MKNISNKILEEINDKNTGEFEAKKNFLYSMYDKIKEGWDKIEWQGPMSFEMDMDVDTMCLMIYVDGDWKHEHGLLDEIAEETTHPIKMEQKVTFSTGMDSYPAIHYFYYAPLKKESAPIRKPEKNLSKAILEATDEEYERYMAQEKELADDYYQRLCKDITEERRTKFSELRDLTDENKYWDKELIDSFWIPKAFIYAVEGSGKGHHLNQYMDLTTTDIYFMVYENDTIEQALESLFKEYKADSAYSWGDNFLYALDKANPNAYQEYKDENLEYFEEPEEE